MTKFNELKNRMSLGKVMAHYGCKPEGTKGEIRCPFHSPDNTPSLKYDLTSMPHRFKCFGCDARGDVLNFIQLSEPCTSSEVEKIAKTILMTPSPIFSPVETQTIPLEKEKEITKEIPTISTDRFINLLEAIMDLCPLPNDIVQKYLLGQEGFSFDLFDQKENGYVETSYQPPNFQSETLKHFRVGFLGKKYADLVKTLKAQGFTEDELLFTKIFSRTKSGEIRTGGFAGRILYPYIRQGRVVGLAGRQTEYSGIDKFKKCTTHPEANPVRLMNEDVLDTCDYVLITEGVTDCLKAHEAGVQSITPATIEIPNDTYELLAPRLKEKEVIICFDTDDAGKKGAVATQTKLKNCGIESRIAKLPPSKKGKKDVCDFINRFGAEAFRQLIFKV